MARRGAIYRPGRRAFGPRRAVGLLLGLAADRLLGDPRRGHPVAGFGSAASALERLTYRDSRSAGAVHVVILVGSCIAAGTVLGSGVVAMAATTWVVLGGTSLAGQGRALADELTAGDVDAARERLPSLCGRDPAVLDIDGLARAGLESVAENTSDAAVAPLLWGAVAGVPGLLAYRAVNTLDAMIGYHSPRYERFGWAAARLDDVANLLPARLCGVLTLAAAPLVGGSGREGWAAWRRDAAAHPSPNAGVAEASVAGVLGVRLGGSTDYVHAREDRPVLGAGRSPTPADLRRAATLSGWVQFDAGLVLASSAVAVGHGLLAGGGHRRGRQQ